MQKHVCIIGFVCVLFLSPAFVSAHPVISEVAWAGSDLSSADEWMEIALPDCIDGSPCEAQFDLSGYQLTSLKSTGLESPFFTFPAGTIIYAGDSIVIASKHAADSRLLQEPAFFVSAMTLANTKLLLKLKNLSGSVIDQADDGNGSPFAGSNPTGGIGRASMERIDLAVGGEVESNWRTATDSVGFDDGAQDFGTPGHSNGSIEECTDPLSIGIDIQSGQTSGIAPMSINVQAIALTGSLGSDTCHWNFGDGAQSESCNPPSHSYGAGSFLLALEVVNQCGNTLTQSLSITVQPGSSSSSSSSSSGPQDLGDLRLAGVVPNPSLSDKDREWFEIKNMEDRAVQLAGWKVEVGASKPKRYAIDWITQVGAHETVRSYQNESTVTLSNGAGHIGLVNPNGVVVSSIDWDKANENEVFKPQPFLDEQIQGDVVSVLDTATVTLMLDPASEALVGEDLVTVHMLGVELPEQTTENLLVLDDGYEFTSALLESKKVELIFDTKAWTNDGELQAYLGTDDDLRLVEEKLLEKGLVQVSGTGAKVHRQQFLEIEEMAKRQQLGLWAYTKPDLLASLHLSIIPIASATGSSFPLGLASVGSLKITEVFAAPDHSDSDCVTGPSTTGCEWIEIYNNSENMIDLLGFSVSINGKSKKITKSSSVRAQSYILLYAKQHKFALANDGGAISLVSPSGTVIDTVTYPKTKKGISYAISEAGACFVTQPSPGMNSSCIQSAKEPLGKTKSIATSKAKKTTKTRAPYTLPIAENHESVTIQSAVESHPIRWLVAGLCVGFALCLIVMRKWATKV